MSDASASSVNEGTIKAWNSELRPREKAVAKGFSALTVPELWALIIGSGTKGMNVMQVCTELMARNAFSLTSLSRKSLKEIADVKGLGPKKGLQIMAALEIAKRFQQQQLPERPLIRSSADAFNILRPEIGHIAHEEMWVLLLNRSHHVVRTFRSSQGHATATIFDVKGIMKEAILEQADGLILAHNHPSGQLTPSGPDDSITLKCREACKTVEVSFLDHIIVTAASYYSYRDSGRL